MKKVVALLFGLALCIGSITFPSEVSAQAQSCSAAGVTVNYSPSPPTARGWRVYFTPNQALFNSANSFDIRLMELGERYDSGGFTDEEVGTGGIRSITRAFGEEYGAAFAFSPGTYRLMLRVDGQDYCETSNVTIGGSTLVCRSGSIQVPSETRLFERSTISFNTTLMDNYNEFGLLYLKVNGVTLCEFKSSDQFVGQCGNPVSYTFLQEQNTVSVGTANQNFCSFNVDVTEEGTTVDGGAPQGTTGTTSEPYEYDLCAQIADDAAKTACNTCRTSGNDSGDVPNENSLGGVWTALGCIKTDPISIVQQFVQIGLSIAGTIALLMILAAGFIFSTSQGDPKRTSSAKELLTSAVVGLLFIIFSVTILQFIGVQVLRIPGFGV